MRVSVGMIMHTHFHKYMGVSMCVYVCACVYEGMCVCIDLCWCVSLHVRPCYNSRLNLCTYTTRYIFVADMTSVIWFMILSMYMYLHVFACNCVRKYLCRCPVARNVRGIASKTTRYSSLYCYCGSHVCILCTCQRLHVAFAWFLFCLFKMIPTKKIMISGDRPI